MMAQYWTQSSSKVSSEKCYNSVITASQFETKASLERRTELKYKLYSALHKKTAETKNRSPLGFSEDVVVKLESELNCQLLYLFICGQLDPVCGQ